MKKFLSALVIVCMFIPAHAAPKKKSGGWPTGLYHAAMGEYGSLYLSLRDKDKTPAIILSTPALCNYYGTIHPGKKKGTWDISFTLHDKIKNTLVAEDAKPDFPQKSDAILSVKGQGLELMIGDRKFDMTKKSWWDIVYSGMGNETGFEILFGSADEKFREYLLLAPEGKGSFKAGYFSMQSREVTPLKITDWHLKFKPIDASINQNEVPQQELRLCFTLTDGKEIFLDMEMDFFRSPVTDLGMTMRRKNKSVTRFWQANDSNNRIYCARGKSPQAKKCEQLNMFNVLVKKNGKGELVSYNETLFRKAGSPGIKLFRLDADKGILKSLQGKEELGFEYRQKEGTPAKIYLTHPNGVKEEFTEKAFEDKSCR